MTIDAYHTSSDGTDSVSDNFSTTIRDKYAGEWVQIELPRKLKISNLVHIRSNSGRSPKDFAFAGSKRWLKLDLMKTYGGETSWTELQIVYHNLESFTAYKYIPMLITHVHSTMDSLRYQAFEVHGTESGDVIARIGDGFDGKVRNLRVYLDGSERRASSRDFRRGQG